MAAKDKLNLVRILKRTFIFLPVFVLLLSSCYPLTVTTSKWRIRWDKDLKKGKETFVESSKQKQNDRPPNIVILMADDLGKYEVSAYGVDHISTPNIDSIGYAGVIFEDAYVTAPTCAPSRAGIMTGRVQNRYGFETQVMEFYPTNMVEYLSGKYFVNTGSFVMEAKPNFPSQYQV